MPQRHYFKLILMLPAPARQFLITEALFGLGIGIWSLILNFHLKSVGFSEVQIGIALAVGPVSTAVFSILVGQICDKAGFRLVMIAGCILKGVIMAIIPMIPFYPFVLAAFLLMGLGDALILSSEFPYLLNLVEEKDRNLVYSLLLSVFMFFMILGNAMGGFLPGVLNSSGSGRYMPFIIISGLCIIVMGLLRVGIPESRKAFGERSTFLDLFKSRKTVMFLLYSIIAGCAFNVLASMSNLIFREFMGFSESSVGIIFVITNLAGFVATLLVPLVLQRYRSTRIATVLFILSIVILVMMAFSAKTPFVMLWILCAFLRIMLPGTVESPMLQSIPYNQQGVYSGMKIFSNQIGISIGAYMAGSILMFSGVTLLMLVTAVLTFSQFAVYYSGCKRHL